jgi:hypothetical protein
MSTYLGGGGGDTKTSVELEGITIDNVEISNDVGNPVPVVTGFHIPAHDNIALTYTGDNLTGVAYKVGATTVATLTLAYTGSRLDSVTKS